MKANNICFYIIRRLLLIIPTIFIVSIIVFIISAWFREIVDIMVSNFRTSQKWISWPSSRLWGLMFRFTNNIYTGWDKYYCMAISGSLSGPICRWWTMSERHGRSPWSLEQWNYSGPGNRVAIGIYSAMRQDTIGDYLARSFAVICIAVPASGLGQCNSFPSNMVALHTIHQAHHIRSDPWVIWKCL